MLKTKKTITALTMHQILQYITLKIHPSIPTIMFRLTRVEGLKPVIQQERVRENENHIVKYDIHDLDQMLKCDNTLV